MPPKKTCLGRKTPKAKGMNSQCQEETPQSRETHLQVMCATASTSRQEETPQARDTRLQVMRSTAAATRQVEIPEAHQARIEPIRRAMAEIRSIPFRQLAHAAFNYDPTVDYAEHANIGKMNVECQYCHALRWPGEPSGICCSGGKVHLPPIRDPPEPLKMLLKGETVEARHFLENIRAYNSTFQMTSFGAGMFDAMWSTFRVQGQVYHRIGSLQPLPNATPEFLQLYFIADQNEQAQQRRINFPQTRLDVTLRLQEMLHG